jgi:anti-sigma regulatory factor (Ser/Thr protein kinase)
VRADCSFAPQLSSASEARQFVGAQLRSWDCDDLVADAELAVSELAANAILHAESPFVVSLELEGWGLRIEVYDSSDEVPQPVAPQADLRSGWGLLILDRLVERWGVDTRARGKVVWAELALP